MAQLTVTRDIWIGAPRERVWQAVTDPQQVAQWFLPPELGAQLKLDEDGTLSVLMGPMAVVVAEVVSVEPPRRVTSRGLPERTIAITYALDAEKEGTHVTVTMTGFAALPE